MPGTVLIQVTHEENLAIYLRVRGFIRWISDKNFCFSENSFLSKLLSPLPHSAKIELDRVEKTTTGQMDSSEAAISGPTQKTLEVAVEKKPSAPVGKLYSIPDLPPAPKLTEGPFGGLYKLAAAVDIETGQQPAEFGMKRKAPSRGTVSMTRSEPSPAARFGSANSSFDKKQAEQAKLASARNTEIGRAHV